MKFLRLKDLPIAFRLWIVIMCFVLTCLLILGVAFKMILNYTRDETDYASIEKSQEMLKNGQAASGDESGIIPKGYDAVVSVYHIGIVNRQVRYMTFPSSKFEGMSVKFIDMMGSSYSAQKKSVARYKLTAGDYTLYYIIRRSGSSGIISFRVDASNEAVYKTADLVILAFYCGAALLSLLLAILFARTLAGPLSRLEKAAARTAAGDFDTPVGLDRKDEIGRLSEEIDKARVELKRRDFLRQSAIQYVSHELKTPIMTISSYAQAILDKVYPLGSLEESVRVIAAQSERMQRIVMKLLTLTRLDYLESRPKENTKIDLAGVAEDVCARLGASRRDVRTVLHLEDVVICGSKEELTVLAENLIENALRHAAGNVEVWAGREDGTPFLSVFNDGGGIDEGEISFLFDVFRKGSKGITGLGLSIVKRIADGYRAGITVKNQNGGVCIFVKFPPDSASGEE